MRERYIRASELRSFSFCRRAWFLEQQGQASLLQPERERGTLDHRQHGQAVQAAAASSRFSSALFFLSALLALAALAWWIAQS
jgi:hypothetical protein